MSDQLVKFLTMYDSLMKTNKAYGSNNKTFMASIIITVIIFGVIISGILLYGAKKQQKMIVIEKTKDDKYEKELEKKVNVYENMIKWHIQEMDKTNNQKFLNNKPHTMHYDHDYNWNNNYARIEEVVN